MSTNENKSIIHFMTDVESDATAAVTGKPGRIAFAANTSALSWCNIDGTLSTIRDLQGVVDGLTASLATMSQLVSLVQNQLAHIPGGGKVYTQLQDLAFDIEEGTSDPFGSDEKDLILMGYYQVQVYHDPAPVLSGDPPVETFPNPLLPANIFSTDGFIYGVMTKDDTNFTISLYQDPGQTILYQSQTGIMGTDYSFTFTDGASSFVLNFNDLTTIDSGSQFVLQGSSYGVFTSEVSSDFWEPGAQIEIEGVLRAFNNLGTPASNYLNIYLDSLLMSARVPMSPFGGFGYAGAGDADLTGYARLSNLSLTGISYNSTYFCRITTDSIPLLKFYPTDDDRTADTNLLGYATLWGIPYGTVNYPIVSVNGLGGSVTVDFRTGVSGLVENFQISTLVQSDSRVKVSITCLDLDTARVQFWITSSDDGSILGNYMSPAVDVGFTFSTFLPRLTSQNSSGGMAQSIIMLAGASVSILPAPAPTES